MAVRLNKFFVFDTDLLSEYIREKRAAIKVLEAIPLEEWRTTVINEIELLSGRFQQIQTANTVEQLVNAQQRLDHTRRFLSVFPTILTIDGQAACIFFDLSRQRGLRKVGRRDLLIAAISLRHSCTLMTGNTRHFALVPRLKLVDWRSV